MSGTNVRVKGIKRYREPKTGRWYCYHRATGKRIEEEFGTGAFFARLAALDHESAAMAGELAKPGTLKALILDYKSSERFTDLAPRTRSDYDKVFQYLEPLWDKPLALFTKDTLVKARKEKWKKERGRRFVNYVTTVLRIVFAHGVDENIAKTNPLSEMRQVRRDKNAKPLNRRWTDEERAAAWAEVRFPLRLPFAVGMCYGMRQGDVLRAKRAVIAQGLMHVKTGKSSVAINMPIMSEVRQAYADHRDHEVKRHGTSFDAMVLCTTSEGQPWTESGFRASFRTFKKRLEAEGKIGSGCTFHGLRHSVASDIAELEGTTEEDIQAVLGQRNSESARPYIEEANRSRRAGVTVTKLWESE